MLEKLTEDQEKLMIEVRDKWLNHFFSLEFDEKKAIELISFAYEEIMGWEKPEIIILDSPLACQVATNLLSSWTGFMSEVGDKVRADVWEKVRDKVSADVWEKVWDKVRDKVSDKVGDKVSADVWEKVGDKVSADVWEKVRDKVSADVWEKVGEKVWDKVSDKVRADVWEKVWEKVGEKVRADVWEKVWEKVRADVWEKVGEKVRDKVGEKVRADVWEKVWEKVSNKLEYHEISWRLSSHDFYWVAYYDYFTEIGIINHKLFNRFRDLIRANIFSLILFKEIVFISKPPIHIKRNEKDDMHSIEGYAIEFADGFGLHYINGRHFTDQEFYDYIKREPSAKEIMKVDNQELRAEVIKHWGYDKIVSELQLKELDTYEDSILYSCKEFPINFVRVIDATSKKPYFLGVPRGQTDCLEAIAWTFGLTGKEYENRIES